MLNERSSPGYNNGSGGLTESLSVKSWESVVISASSVVQHHLDCYTISLRYFINALRVKNAVTYTRPALELPNNSSSSILRFGLMGPYPLDKLVYFILAGRAVADEPAQFLQLLNTWIVHGPQVGGVDLGMAVKDAKIEIDQGRVEKSSQTYGELCLQGVP
jgi:hypothetical protein